MTFFWLCSSVGASFKRLVMEWVRGGKENLVTTVSAAGNVTPVDLCRIEAESEPPTLRGIRLTALSMAVVFLYVQMMIR